MHADTLAPESAAIEISPGLEKLRLDEFDDSTPEDWRKAAEPFLKGAPFEKKLVTRTPEGIALQPIYFAGTDATANRPGRFGGVIAQEIAANKPDEFNRILLAELMAGLNCTPIRLSEAARHALDPGEAADVPATDGVSIASLRDLQTALAGVDLDAAPLFVWTGASALPFLALLGALTVSRDCSTENWNGAVLADPLTTAAHESLRGLSLPDAFDEMATCVQWADECMPRLRVIGVDAAAWADAGASAVDELAFAIATAAESLRELSRRGVSAPAAARRMTFAFSLGSRVFMEIAKLRAARRLWSRILETLDCQEIPMSIHGRSNVFVKSSLDAHTNLLRATADAFAGIVGGVESLQISAFDETTGNPTEFSRRIARNIPIILSEECGLSDVADAAGGSWFIENLTGELAERAWERFQEIEAAGGMASALRAGIPQRAATATAGTRLAAMAGCRETMVSVNLSANPAEQPAPAAKRNPVVPSGSDPVRRDGAHISDIPSAVEAFLSGWTIGQVRRALPRKSDESKIERIAARRLAGPFEYLRKAAWKWTADFGHAPAVWLATFGPPRQHRARADFSSAFLACGGFEVRSGKAAANVADAVSDAVAVGLPVVVICSTDETYPDIVPVFAAALKKARPNVHLLLAGAPGDNEAAWRAAGVDGFIHLRVNRLEFLENLLSTLSSKLS